MSHIFSPLSILGNVLYLVLGKGPNVIPLVFLDPLRNDCPLYLFNLTFS
jgi:hypothetical protein